MDIMRMQMVLHNLSAHVTSLHPGILSKRESIPNLSTPKSRSYPLPFAHS
jgi:hypothetical protein